MGSEKNKVLLFLTFLVIFLSRLEAEDRRTLPLDFYLIIDGSDSFQSTKNGAIDWIGAQIIDRILVEGDSINIWVAGNSSELVFSGEVSAPGGNTEAMEKLKNLTATGRSADFSGALREVEARLARTAQGRLPYTMLITASAGGLGASLSGNSPASFRWFRSERYERWQVLILAPDIGRKVNESALEYMNYAARS